jgi:hypothetical protein
VESVDAGWWKRFEARGVTIVERAGPHECDEADVRVPEPLLEACRVITTSNLVQVASGLVGAFLTTEIAASFSPPSME